MATEALSRFDDEHVIVRGLWRALDVFRIFALAYAVWAVWERHGEIARPGAAVAVLAVIGAWTALQALRPRRTVPAYLVELGLACGAILATRLVDHEWVIIAGAKTVPSIWSSAAVVGLAVLLGWRGGLAAAAAVTVSSVVEVIEPTANTISNSVFVFLLGGFLGYVVDLARAGHAAHLEALRIETARRERDRLARTVHDGVLQTLAYINRVGSDLGGESARLGAMAGAQERMLRTLVSGSELDEVSQAVTGPADLRSSLRHIEGESVQLVAPSEPLRLPRRVVDELVAAVEAALDNVRRHAGDGARAWVLLDHDGQDVTVTIRDSGRGLPEGRLEEAVGEGRLGVASSIRGRLADLGGAAHVRSRLGQGTTVELRVPAVGGGE
jgi:signal transduction histidine kinase